MRASLGMTVILAVARIGVLASCSIPSSSTTTISDASAIASCTKFSGNIAIATNAATNIEFERLEEITGSLIASEVPNMVRLIGENLVKIGGNFTLESCELLAWLKFREMTSVGGIYWRGLASLSSTKFDGGLRATRVEIQDTFLGKIDIAAADEIIFANNRRAKEVSIELNNVTKSLEIRSNSANMSLSLPNLYWANNLSISDVAALDMPLLNTINESLILRDNVFDSLDVPNLNTVRAEFRLENNRNITELQLPSALQLSTVNISNNENLKDIRMPEVSVIRGAFSIRGNLSTVALPNVQRVYGAFRIESNNDTFNCGVFDELESQNVITGQYQCQGKHPDPAASSLNAPIASATGTDTQSSASQSASAPRSSDEPSGLSTSGKAGVGVGVTVGFLAAIGVGAWMLVRRKQLRGSSSKAHEVDGRSPLNEKMHESRPMELGVGNEAQELPAAHGSSEVGGAPNVRTVQGTHELP